MKQYVGLKLKVITFNRDDVITMSVETASFDFDWTSNGWEGQS